MTEHNKKLGDLENKYTMSLKSKKVGFYVIELIVALKLLLVCLSRD